MTYYNDYAEVECAYCGTPFLTKVIPPAYCTEECEGQAWAEQKILKQMRDDEQS